VKEVSETDLRVIGKLAKQVQGHNDSFWNKCKEKGWFESCPGLLDQLMWAQHEQSRNLSTIEFILEEIEKNNPDIVP
jgi:hypothetical protein